MESIAVTKPDMGVLPRHRLALSPFGTLAQTFAEELLARAERAEGRWPYVPLELLEEAPPDAEPAPAPVYQVDLRLVLEALRRAGATFEDRETAAGSRGDPITKADLFALGLTGGTDSAARRQALLKALDLPEHLTPNGMLEALNLLYSREAFLALAAEEHDP